MQRAGLVSRERLPENRRVQRVELTDAGEQAFLRLRDAARRFDATLRGDLSQDDVDRLRELLETLAANVTDESERPPSSRLT
jgi:MarR family transcriptional regulator for hemolysin